ncbi:amidohydrolase family protein [Microbacterium enclense]|uniref:amidohydrolase family protein n=1 Tax=Microbacterium enclense TaxID=993073 RepID=UPI0021A570C0|nr:amidohydrolase family protein [Microbacterium enclense]MCT2085391.1 amidohydrolase family protein [Microbacterium enclense]
MTAVIHRAPVVLSPGSVALTDGAVAVAGDRILAVGPADEVLAAAGPDAEVHEWDGALTPGLVNAHTHLQYSDMAAVGLAEHAGFEAWMRAFMELYPVPRDWGASAAAGAALALRSGTTAVAEIVTDAAAGSAVHDAGLHGIAFWEVLGWTDRAWADGGESTVRAQLAALPTPPATGLSPHAIYSLDTGVIRDLARLAQQLGVRQHIHAAESAWEDAYVRTGTGDLAERWRANGRGEFALLRHGGVGTGVLRYLDDLGALTPTTHLAHGIYVDADDRALLRTRGVSVALCPRSNAVIGLDAPPVAAYLREGNAIAVGTDSLSSSPSLSPWQDVAALYDIARAQGYRDDDLHARLFAAATAGGAHALGLEDTGVLRVGARADLAVFPVAASTPREALAELVEAGPAEASLTVVGGRVRWATTIENERTTAHV